ncbi:Patatin [Gammaproteobacteria bacterium 45_16_T64]|nr:Patatin [Gammaproteobacteria bacterium 45_16_T64]
MTKKEQSRETHLHCGLVLSGGGARAAYQVGVLKAIADIMPVDIRNPFGVISGTSAGAINAVALAAHAENYRNAVYAIEQVWRHFKPHLVYRTDPIGVGVCGIKFLMRMFMAMPNHPASLLNNKPLAKLLEEMIPFDHIKEAIRHGYLRSISVTASGYNSGHSVAFFDGSPDISSWKRFQRVGLRASLSVEHLLASSAIPTVFPAVRINREYFGDGAVRQLAPLSPALHMGAKKLLVVGVSGNRSAPQVRKATEAYPSLAQIGGHLLNSVFLDSLEYDVERLERINDTLELIPDNVREKSGITMNPIECLLISPSQCVDQIAAKFAKNLPLTIRIFLHGIGATDTSGSSVLSYLLFERQFCNALIELGYHDAMEREEEIRTFLHH